MPHNFNESYERGEKWESEIDAYFKPSYCIKPATRMQERNGIDRIFTCRKTGTQFSVEYKSDEKALDTGNVFIETVSVDTEGKAGWALSSLAQVLIYYLPNDGRIHYVPMLDLKRKLTDWVKRYKKRTAKNEDYNTVGLLVPLPEFQARCRWIECIPKKGAAHP